MLVFQNQLVMEKDIYLVQIATLDQLEKLKTILNI